MAIFQQVKQLQKRQLCWYRWLMLEKWNKFQHSKWDKSSFNPVIKNGWNLISSEPPDCQSTLKCSVHKTSHINKLKKKIIIKFKSDTAFALFVWWVRSENKAPLVKYRREPFDIILPSATTHSRLNANSSVWLLQLTGRWASSLCEKKQCHTNKQRTTLEKCQFGNKIRMESFDEA